MEIQSTIITATVATTVLSTVFVDNSIDTPSIYLTVATGIASIAVGLLSIGVAAAAAYGYKSFQKWQANMEEKQKEMDERQKKMDERQDKSDKRQDGMEDQLKKVGDIQNIADWTP